MANKLIEQEKGDRFEVLIARGRQPPWPRDIELAEKAVAENRRAVLLGEGSVLYVSEGETVGESVCREP